MKKTKINRMNYSYDIQGGYVYGAFNIYQARNGSLQLVMGNRHTELTKKQIDDLNIDVYSLIDFDDRQFSLYYS